MIVTIIWEHWIVHKHDFMFCNALTIADCFLESAIRNHSLCIRFINITDIETEQNERRLNTYGIELIECELNMRILLQKTYTNSIFSDRKYDTSFLKNIIVFQIIATYCNMRIYNEVVF